MFSRKSTCDLCARCIHWASEFFCNRKSSDNNSDDYDYVHTLQRNNTSVRSQEVDLTKDFILTPATYVIVNALSVKKNSARLVVDTGANLSVIKFHKVKDNVNINVKYQLLIESFGSGGKQDTYGLFKMRFKFDKGVLIEHPFHVISGVSDINADGILGMDFLKKYKACIDFSEDLLKFEFDDNYYYWKLH